MIGSRGAGWFWRWWERKWGFGCRLERLWDTRDSQRVLSQVCWFLGLLLLTSFFNRGTKSTKLRRKRGREKQITWKRLQTTRIHQKGRGSNQMNALSRSRPRSSKKKTKNKGIKNQLFEFVRAIEDLIADGFFSTLFRFDLPDNTIDTLADSFTDRETLFVNLGKAKPSFYRCLFVGFLQGDRYKHPRLGSHR